MKKMLKMLDKTEDIISSSLLVITSVLVFVEAVLRYRFNYSISWSEEVSRMMIAWFIFIGSSIAVRENAHVNMDALSNLISGKRTTQLFVNILVDLICIIFCAIIVFAGINMIKSAIALGSMATSIKIPLFVPYASVPVGVFLMMIRYIMSFINNITDLIRFTDTRGGVQ